MHKISLSSSKHNEMLKLNDQLNGVIAEMGIQDGILTLYCPHTTAGLTINEGFDSAVQLDIKKQLKRIAPQGLPHYTHMEGNSDSHIKAVLMGNSVQVFVEDGKLQLGQWQAVYFCEFDGPRSREVWVK